MRYLGLDLGSKTLGIALSDSTGKIASPYDIIRYSDYNELIDRLNIIISEFNITEVALGNPLNMSGSESKRSIESIYFKNLLEDRLNIKVYMQDERLTTMEAEKILINNNTRRNKRKKVIDKLAATIILQTFLDKRSSNYE